MTQTLSFNVSMTGNWSFNFQPKDGSAEQFVFALAESGSSVSGSVSFSPPLTTGEAISVDSITGTITGSALTFTWALWPSADPRNPACVGLTFTITGTAQIGASGASMMATVNATTNPCDPQSLEGSLQKISGQTVTLTKG